MKNNFIFIIFITFLFSLDSKDLLSDLVKNKSWKLIDENEKRIYEYKNKYLDCKYLKIEKNINQNPKLVFDVIKDIEQYNSIISNKNLYSNLVHVDNDTLYVYQLNKNSIPFIRDRQYVFKMFQVSDNRIDWYILSKENEYLDVFNKDIKTLTFGAGSWTIKDIDKQTILINKIYVNDEVKMPDIFIRRFKIENIVNIFDDILKFSDQKERKD